MNDSAFTIWTQPVNDRQARYRSLTSCPDFVYGFSREAGGALHHAWQMLNCGTFGVMTVDFGECSIMKRRDAE